METIQKISLDLIDDPKLAMRGNFDDEKLSELMASMKELGLVEPVVLRPVGDRYEVIAGHRRTRAARLLNWPNIEAKTIEADDATTLAMRLAENSDRADVNVVDEACFISEIILKYHYTVEQIAKAMRKSGHWIEVRLEIGTMPDYMQEHLRFGKYAIGAALWLNKIKNESTKKYYAFYAAINGVSITGAEKWYRDLEATNFVFDSKTGEIIDGNIAAPRHITLVKCARCGGDGEIMGKRTVFVHPHCPEDSVVPSE